MKSYRVSFFVWETPGSTGTGDARFPPHPPRVRGMSIGHLSPPFKTQESAMRYASEARSINVSAGRGFGEVRILEFHPDTPRRVFLAPGGGKASVINMGTLREFIVSDTRIDGPDAAVGA